MERVSKSLTLPDWMAASVRELADREKRSFNREGEVLLEGVLKPGDKEPVEAL
jgi:hypothetical protein